MRCTIGTTVVMTGLVVAMLAFRPPVMDDPSIVKAQAEASGTKATKTTAPSDSNQRLSSDDPVTEGRLEKRIDADFTDLPARDALNYISDQIKVQFYIDQQSLEGASVTAETPVTLSLQNVPAEMVLDIILRQLKLDYRLLNGVVMVASAADVQAQTEVRVYRVREGMAEELAALIPATIDANLWSEHAVVVNGSGRRRAGYGSMGAPSRGGYGAPGRGGYGAPGYGGVELAEGESIESIGGAGAGTIRVFRGTLVISQTPEVHERIEKLLDDLAGAGAMDVQKRSDGPGVDRTGMMPAPQPQSPFSGQPGYGQGGGRGQTGYGPSGYGTTGRGGHGATGGSRGGYGSEGTGYGTGNPSEDRGRAGGERRGRGASGDAAPAGGSSPGQPPSSGGLSPTPQDPNGTADSPLGPSAPGGETPGTIDPNAAEPDSA
jgi:hypothetical protein